MSKRFTDSEKWRDPWFRRLPTEYKLLWLYLLDECDVSGVWKVDLELATMIIGYTYPLDEALEQMGDRVKIFDNGEKWWIPKFIEFQYRILKAESKPHAKVIGLLRKCGLYKTYVKGMYTPKEEEEAKDKEEAKAKEEDQENVPF